MILVIGAGFAGSYLLKTLCGNRDEDNVADDVEGFVDEELVLELELEDVEVDEDD